MLYKSRDFWLLVRAISNCQHEQTATFGYPRTHLAPVGQIRKLMGTDPMQSETGLLRERERIVGMES